MDLATRQQQWHTATDRMSIVKARFFGLILVSLVMVSCSPSRSEQTEEKPTAARLYEMNCAVCHGADGKLGNSGAYDLTQSTSSDREVRKIILEGKNAMPPFLELVAEPEQLDSLLVHLKRLKKNK